MIMCRSVFAALATVAGLAIGLTACSEMQTSSSTDETAGGSSAAAPTDLPLTVSVDKPGAKFNPMFYGLMTEEINYSYDGGLYAELLRNRIFKEEPVGGGRGGRGGGGGRGRGRGGDAAASAPAGPPPPAPAPIPHWSTVAQGGAKAAMEMDKTDPINTVALDTSLKVSMTGMAAGARAGVANDGYWGIPIKPGTTYKASFYAKAQGISGPLTVAIESTDGKTVYASGTVASITGEWKKYDLTLTTSANVQPMSGCTTIPNPAATTAPAGGGGGGGGRGRGGPQPPFIGHIDTHFVVTAQSNGTLWLNLVSLMPPTFNNRANGNRVDIMDLLNDMHPAFLRFPGGNYVEGNSFENHFDWRRTLGPLENRPGHPGTWQYRSTDGMGLMEYLLWCEDLKMEPLLAVFAGHILGNPTPGREGNDRVVTGEALKPYIQEALDEIEYVTGPATSEWGARRAKDGHPEPFKLTYVEIGNEDNLSAGQDTYEERYAAFYDAIKAKYPNLQIISTVPSTVTAGRGAPYKRVRTPDVIDDHYYMNVQQALQRAHFYDKYDRKGPKIFIGEWATRIGDPTSTFLAALADAAFLTGMERNADVIMMTCYAPLFVNVNPPYPQYPGGPLYPGGQQWATDLIGYDGLTSFGSAGYYVQKMFYNNRGDVVLPIELPAPAQGNPDVFACASRDTNGDVILKMVSGRGSGVSMDIALHGVTQVDPNASGWILTADLQAVNTVKEPTKVSPRPITISNAAAKFTYSLPSNAVVVLRIKAK